MNSLGLTKPGINNDSESSSNPHLVCVARLALNYSSDVDRVVAVPKLCTQQGIQHTVIYC